MRLIEVKNAKKFIARRTSMIFIVMIKKCSKFIYYMQLLI